MSVRRSDLAEHEQSTAPFPMIVEPVDEEQPTLTHRFSGESDALLQDPTDEVARSLPVTPEDVRTGPREGTDLVTVALVAAAFLSAGIFGAALILD